MKYLSVALSLGLALGLTGCFAKIHQLPAHPDKTAPVFAPLSDHETLVGIAVSGGGSRAAAFAAGALEALANIRILESGQPRSVLELVTHMSSVSGGSLATAYYAVKKPAKAEAVFAEQSLSPAYRQFFASFKEDMQKNFQLRAIGRQLVNFRVANPTKFAYSFADVWDANFFEDVTFAELYERERRGDAPQIILNGTIYNTGRRTSRMISRRSYAPNWRRRGSSSPRKGRPVSIRASNGRNISSCRRPSKISRWTIEAFPSPSLS
jgi:patatin-like phospholipase